MLHFLSEPQEQIPAYSRNTVKKYRKTQMLFLGLLLDPSYIWLLTSVSIATICSFQAFDHVYKHLGFTDM